ncbi:unnamed protein product (macronuclear) [Paramecium tetraurelia]|uniref:IBB domain-containing protein n=1 Tax=Paramecium tetraurelia TaxID=5888 RepID=A0D4S8_PARTE|nr:uncharacterized protein GSPATT00013492001 [Paramecium tetraurelia]CAK78045.1 unnamed protein product [Paramecium tetraurelia]|eukprot:XP_001445442.1 hypothetical protein (macronuclear) [Paramecium tetraurelia strain d4-2]
MFNKPQEYAAQKKEAFRSEIRRIDRERIFNQKRILIHQQNEMKEKDDLELTNLIPQIILCQQNQNIKELKQLHRFAFNSISTNNLNQITQNQEFLIKNNYLQHSLPSLIIKEVQCEVIRTLANSCNHPLFLQQQPQNLLQSLEVSYQLLLSLTDTQDISDILIYLGNISNRWPEICQYLIKSFDRMLELSSSNDSNLYRNICFCMHNICYVMDNQNLSVKDRITCLKVIDKGVNRNDCDFLQNEILHPLTVLYFQNEEIDKYLMSSKIVQYVITTLKGEFVETTLQVLKQFSLTETISFSNFLIEQDILGIAYEYSNNRKKQIRKFSFLIVINLAYNDSKISNKIVKHKIINRVINGLNASGIQEKQNCIQVIQNLQKTGDNAVFQTLIELGTVEIIGNLIDEVDTVVLKIFVDALCRFLNYAKEVQSNKVIEDIKKIKPKLELIYNDNKDPKFQDLFQLFLQLLQQ